MKPIFHSTPRSRRARPQQHEAQTEQPAAFFQPKLTINAPGNQYEREADAVADRVVSQQGSNQANPGAATGIQRMPISRVQRLATPEEDKMPATNDARMEEDKKIQEKPEPGAIVQKMDAPKEEEKPVQKMDAPKEKEKPVQKMDAPKEEEKPVQKAAEEEEPVQAKSQSGATPASPNFSSRLSARKGGGTPLPAQARTQMEQGIGADFSQVRIHTDSEAVQMNKEIQAQAFTHGQDVYFNSGKFSPESGEGKRLLAHEMTHVVQQSPEARNAASGSPEIQKKDDKAVSSTAMARIGLAQNAIRHTKQVFSFGAGNQKNALRSTKFNSWFRMRVMRDKDEFGNTNKGYWKLTDSVKPIADADPNALLAAKADIAHGGNCGEHGSVAFDYLRANTIGEPLSFVAHRNDHAFVLIGRPDTESDAEIVVADAWPTAPTATVWEDHFDYSPGLAKVKTLKKVTSDGADTKSVIAAGLTLSDEGKAQLAKSLSTDAEVEAKIAKTTGLYDTFDHSFSLGKDFNYTSQWDKVEFHIGTAKLTSTSEMILDLMAADLAKYPGTSMAIEGHTDSWGSKERNQTLSEDRAKACFDGLIARGISSARLSHAGFGETRPISDNKTFKGRKANRRVEFNLRTS